MDEQKISSGGEAQTSSDFQGERIRLEEENRALLAELSELKATVQRKEEEEQGALYLERMMGSKSGELFDKAVKRANSAELAALPAEKRYELGYLLCLGEQAQQARPAVVKSAEVYPPPFARSGGSGQVPLTAVKEPTSFAMAKENAKKYFKR